MPDDRASLEEAEITARKLGRLLHSQMPKGWGFVLVLASYGEPSAFMTYLSSVQREDALRMLRELLTKVEEGEPQV